MELAAFCHSGAVLLLVMSPRWKTWWIARVSTLLAIHAVWASKMAGWRRE